MTHPAAIAIEQLLADCDIKKTRRGGPGGQHRNKVESAIVITHLPSKIIGQAGERRSQHENRAVAIERLRLNLSLAIREPVTTDQQTSDLWQSRRKGQQFSVSLEHHDFPALLAEALDFLAVADFEVTIAAERLKVSASQLVKFLKSFPPALQLLNNERESRGLNRLQ